MSTNTDGAGKLGWMVGPIAYCALVAGLGATPSGAFASTRTGREAALGKSAPGFPFEGAKEMDLRADQLVPVLVSADGRFLFHVATRKVAYREPFLDERLHRRIATSAEPRATRSKRQRQPQEEPMLREA